MPDRTTGSDELTFLATRLRAETPEEARPRLERLAWEATTHPARQQYEAESALNYQYIENDFYTAEELAQLAARRQPPTKRNEIAPVLERIAGQFIQTRQVATFLGRNTPADDPVGALAQDYLRWVEQTNRVEFEEQDQVWDGLVGGVGWLKCTVRRNERGDWVPVIRQVNAYHVYRDPLSTRYDPNEDAKYIVEGSWMDLEDVIALFPEREAALREMVGAVSGALGPGPPFPTRVPASLEADRLAPAPLWTLSVRTDGGRVRVRPFEVWYKRKTRLYWITTDAGVLAVPVAVDRRERDEMLRAFGDRITAQAHWADRLYVGVFVGSVAIHHDLSPHQSQRFPYVPFYAGLRKNGAPLSLASRLVPINEAINKRESKALALMTNRQLVFEKSALEDPDQVMEELAKPDGAIEVRDNALAQGRVVFRDNLEMGQAQLLLLQEDKDAIRRVSGHGNESMGMPSEVRSGVGIARKQMMSALITTPLQNNLRRTRQLRALLIFEYMKQYLTGPQAFQLTDDPAAARWVQMTAGHIQALKERTYDIVVTDVKDYAVLREQQAEMLLTVLPQLAQLGPGLLKLGVQLTELRDKDGLIRLIDQMHQPAPVQPKMSLALSWQDLTPEVQAYFALTAFQSPEVAQAILQKGADPAFVQRLKAEMAKTLASEGIKASVERGKVDLAALQAAAQGRLEMARLFRGAAASPGPPSGGTGSGPAAFDEGV